MGADKKKKKKIIQKRQNNWIVWPFTPISIRLILGSPSPRNAPIPSSRSTHARMSALRKENLSRNSKFPKTAAQTSLIWHQLLYPKKVWIVGYFIFLHNVNEKFIFYSSSSQIKNSMWHLKSVKTWSTPRMRVSIIINIFRFL